MGWLCFRQPKPAKGEEGVPEAVELRARAEADRQCRPSRESGSPVSPFEKALATRQLLIPPPETGVLFRAASSDQLVSPFDSARSTDFCGSALMHPRGYPSAPAPRSRPMRCSSSSFESARLGLKVLHQEPERPSPAVVGESGSAPPSPKTPRRSGQFASGGSYFSAAPADMDSLDSAWGQAGKNPIRGHPRFRRLKELRMPASGGGSGGALTLLAHDEESQQLVAIKFLRRGSADLDNAANELLNLRMCAAHPFIVRFKQAFLTPEYLAIAMEHTHSGSLQQYVAAHSQGCQGLEEAVARSFFQQLIVALDFCHEMGISHRDIRPENMLLMEPNDAPQLPRAEDVVQLPGGLGRGGVPRLKLHGFHRSSSASFNGGSGGSGSARSGAGSNKSVLDTLAEPSPYTMPEVAGIAYDSKMADVWAAGVLLHYMLTGRLPNLDAGYVPPRHLSEGCRRLLRRMLRTSPAERASIPEIMQNPWFLQDCPEGLEDVDTELLILAEEGMLSSHCEQSETELQALVHKACMPRRASPYAVMGLQPCGERA